MLFFRFREGEQIKKQVLTKIKGHQVLTEPSEGTTRHMSFKKIRQITRLGVLNQLQTNPSVAAVTWSRTIFPSKQVFTVLFQITLFRKTRVFFFLNGQQ